MWKTIVSYLKKRNSMTVTKVRQAKARVTAKLKGLKSMKKPYCLE